VSPQLERTPSPFDRRAPSPFERYLPMAVWALLALAVLYTLHFARAVLFPLALAAILSLLLSPVVQALGRFALPRPVGAALVLAALLGASGLGVYSLSGPAAAWVARAPESLKEVEARGRRLLRPFDRFTRAAAQMEDLASVDTDGATVTTVEVKGPGLGAALFGGVQNLLGLVVVVVPLLYLFLASGDRVLRSVVRALPRLRDKKRAVEIARETQRQISAYLFTLTVLNVGLGIAVAITMGLIGLPNPILWGVVAAVLSYVPTIGGIACGCILALAGLLTFDTLRQAMLPPLLFIVLNYFQDYLLTPLVMGRRLTLNPIVLFVGLVFWWWLWGVPGALLAVPMIATFKIFCDHTEALGPVGELIGDDPPPNGG
jgi:predicted PurR-regulated permease PerM